MYIFEAKYININMDNNSEKIRKIEFDGDNFLETEKECYLYAMGIAYDMQEKDEILSAVEFIAC